MFKLSGISTQCSSVRVEWTLKIFAHILSESFPKTQCLNLVTELPGFFLPGWLFVLAKQFIATDSSTLLNQALNPCKVPSPISSAKLAQPWTGHLRAHLHATHPGTGQLLAVG